MYDFVDGDEGGDTPPFTLIALGILGVAVGAAAAGVAAGIALGRGLGELIFLIKYGREPAEQRRTA